MLANLRTRFGQLAEGLSDQPTRDALVAERNSLLAAGPPPAPKSWLESPPTCVCESCVLAAAEEQRLRVTLAEWEGRVRALETQLARLTWGNAESKDDDEAKARDTPGQELAKLQGELLAAIDTNRGRSWERVVEFDGRGKPLRAYETTAALGAIAADLTAMYRRANGPMVFLSEAELHQAIEDTRRAMLAVLHRQTRRPLEPDVALRAGVEAGAVDDASRHGLVPVPGGNILEGSVRFGKKGRA